MLIIWVSFHLREIFAIHDISYFIANDDRSSFSSQEFDNFCRLKSIKHLTIARYYASSKWSC